MFDLLLMVQLSLLFGTIRPRAEDAARAYQRARPPLAAELYERARMWDLPPNA